MFLMLTTSVMAIEFVYGIASNSLGLISDSFHMMLDSVSIVIGLCAVFASSLSPDQNTHPFGYARYEVLGGFINAVLLLFVAFCVALESVKRIINPPIIEAGYLMLVSSVGLLVNVIGVIFFHDQHSHGHSHSHGGCAGAVDHNMRGVYLHILADLLGSVSVMISSAIITITGAKMSDPICSIVCSLLIATSSIPLLKETGKILLLMNEPYNDGALFRKIVSELEKIPGVQAVLCLCSWTHSIAPRESTFCAVKLFKQQGFDYTTIRSSVKSRLRSVFSMETGGCVPSIITHIE
ncbi:putative cation transporter protein [Trypanosoma vivax]|nr:putative cation transporter protein [Trypanosoma vivax]